MLAADTDWQLSSMHQKRTIADEYFQSESSSHSLSTITTSQSPLTSNFSWESGIPPNHGSVTHDTSQKEAFRGVQTDPLKPPSLPTQHRTKSTNLPVCRLPNNKPENNKIKSRTECKSATSAFLSLRNIIDEIPSRPSQSVDHFKTDAVRWTWNHLVMMSSTSVLILPACHLRFIKTTPTLVILKPIKRSKNFSMHRTASTIHLCWL